MNYKEHADNIKCLVVSFLKGAILICFTALLAFSAFTIYSNWRGASAQWQSKAQQINQILIQERNARNNFVQELKDLKSPRTNKVIKKYFSPPVSKKVIK